MNIGDQALLDATVFDVPDMDEDEPRYRHYTFEIKPTASSNGIELVSVREEDVPRVVASGFGWPAENLPVGSIVASPAWVAIKDDDLDHPNHPWEITGGSGHVSNDTIDKAIADGEARIFRVGDGTEPEVEPETPQPGIIATISTGILTAESTVTVNGATYPIPEQTRWIRPESRTAIHRLLEALQGAGYQPVGGDYRASLVPGGICVEPIAEPADGELRSPAEWLADPEFAGTRILDSDGWGPGEWPIPISRIEFRRRLSLCTQTHPVWTDSTAG